MLKKIEEYLIEKGIISSSQINWAKVKQGESGKPLYKILIEEELISENNYFKILADLFDKEFVVLSENNVNNELIDEIPKEVLEKYNFVPLSKTLDGIKIATYDPNNYFMFQEIEEMTGYKVEFCLATVSDVIKIKKSLGLYYDSDSEIHTLKNVSLKDVAEKIKDGYISGNEEVEDLEDYDIQNTDAPVVVLVNKLIYDGVKKGATDIHLECFEHNIVVRYRIDGILSKVMEIEKSAQEPVITRIKILADLDITERFIPQDGRFKMTISNETIDFRVTFLPSMFGQNISIRIFNKKTTPLSFDEIGLDQEQQSMIKKILGRTYGLVLVVGPTGSGKTTSLYTMLNYINSERIKIITIEDPVEYRMDGIHQIPVKINREDDTKSLHFADGLKAILRQDPNVIMIGEIRDKETAEIAINAALTGHLVFSTIHANTTVDVISRLKHLGINPELISDALTLVIAQRLLRRLCKVCKTPIDENPGEFKKNGCDFCNNTGYHGRIGVFELLPVTENIKESIASEKAGIFIRKTAEENEFWKELKEDAEFKLNAGIIDRTEYEKVLPDFLI